MTIVQFFHLRCSLGQFIGGTKCAQNTVTSARRRKIIRFIIIFTQCHLTG